MQAVQTTHVLTIAASLSAETLCVGTVLDRQVLLIEDYIAIDVCHRHLSSWDEIKVIHLTVIHLSLLVRQLSCAVAGSLVNNCWRHYLCISCSTSLIEEEVDEGSLQTCSQADIDRESGTSNLYAQVEVDEIIFLCQLPVGQGISNTQ